jgi:hypothetical protein
MTIVEDTYSGGTHDLQKGTCSAARFRLAKQEGRLREYYLREVEIPDHGCWENLSAVLEPHGISPEDIPSPFNLYQTMKIDGVSGRMEHTTIRPKPGHARGSEGRARPAGCPERLPRPSQPLLTRAAVQESCQQVRTTALYSVGRGTSLTWSAAIRWKSVSVVTNVSRRSSAVAAISVSMSPIRPGPCGGRSWRRRSA